jgi:hypothetical protein
MLVVLYRTKAELEHCIGQPLRYETGSLLMADYRSFGTLAVEGRSEGATPPWRAEVTLVGGRITRVE